MLSEQLVPPTIARLKALVDFGGRVDRATDLAALVRNGEVTNPVLRAHVIPSALNGRAAQSVAGGFVQDVERGVSVIISLPAFDGTGAAESDRLEGLVIDTVHALAGWAPSATTVGVFRLHQGRLLAMKAGAISYGIDFVIADQVRTAT